MGRVKWWGLLALAWMICVPFMVSGHYEPMQKKSVYVYNAFNTPYKLVEANKDTRELLIRCFPGTWYNTFSFGVPGKVEIEYPLQFDSQGRASTWMPGNKSITSVLTSSRSWIEFQEVLIEQGMQMRKQEVRQLLDRYLVRDVLWMIGPPLVVLAIGFLFKAFRRNSLGLESG